MLVILEVESISPIRNPKNGIESVITLQTYLKVSARNESKKWN